MTHFSNISFANTLTASDAKSLYECGFTHVIDLRCAPCQSARSVEESVVRRLDNYRIHYLQQPMDTVTLDNDRLSTFRSLPFLKTGDVLLVTDLPTEIAREIYLQPDTDAHREREEPLLAVA